MRLCFPLLFNKRTQPASYKPLILQSTALLQYDDIIYIILQFINHQNEIIKLAGVCSSWRRIILQSSEGTFTNGMYCRKPSESLTFLNIIEINLSFRNIELFSQLKNLKNLSLVYTEIDCDCIDFIINQLQLLETLELKQEFISERGFFTIFNPSNVKSFLSTLSVTSLETAQVYNFNIDTLKFPKLTSLEIFGLFDRLVIEQIFNNNSLELKHLKILTSTIDRYCINFSNLHQMHTLKSFSYDEYININIIQQLLNKDIEKLQIGYLDTMSSLNLSKLLVNEYINLNSLELCWCKLSTDCGQFIYNLPNLTELNLGYSKIEPSLCKFIFNMKNLKTLNLKYCGIGNNGLKYITNHNLDNLQTLILDENELTYIGFEYLLNSKFKLPLILLSLHDKLSSNGTLFFDNEKYISSQSLHIRDISMDYKGVISILENCIIEELVTYPPKKLNFISNASITRLSKQKQVKVLITRYSNIISCW